MYNRSLDAVAYTVHLLTQASGYSTDPYQKIETARFKYKHKTDSYYKTDLFMNQCEWVCMYDEPMSTTTHIIIIIIIIDVIIVNFLF